MADQNKVTVEITRKGFTVRVMLGGREVVERWERKPFGCQRTSTSPSFEQAEDVIAEDFYLALSGITSNASDAMDCL